MARCLLLTAPLVLVASAAISQSRVYTNADLHVKSLPKVIDRITPEQLEALAAHQFVLLPIYERPAQQVVVFGS